MIFSFHKGLISPYEWKPMVKALFFLGGTLGGGRLTSHEKCETHPNTNHHLGFVSLSTLLDASIYGSYGPPTLTMEPITWICF